MGGWQQAGNVIRLEGENYWMCEQREEWEHSPELARLVARDMRRPGGGDWPHGDRRQELVFIGQGLDQEFIQTRLDQCLLTDAEMALGPEQWRETMAECDNIQLELRVEDHVEGEFSGEEEDVEESSLKKGRDEENNDSGDIKKRKMESESGELKYFKVAIDAIFQNWSALQLAVTQGAGGPQSKEKAEWMVGVTENWFYENKDLEDFEVADFLDEIMQNEFTLSIDDGSLDDVARTVCEYFTICSSSDEADIKAKLQSLPKCDLSKCQFKDEFNDEEAESNHETVEKAENTDDKSNVAEVDEDGFETVKSRRKK